MPNDVLVLCETHSQFTYFRRFWHHDRHGRGQMHAPDRLFYFSRPVMPIMGRDVEVVVRTGTWFDRPHIMEELACIRAWCPNASWLLEGIPIYVFVKDLDDYRSICSALFIDIADTIPIYSRPGSVTPERLSQTTPQATIIVTDAYRECQAREDMSDGSDTGRLRVEFEADTEDAETGRLRMLHNQAYAIPNDLFWQPESVNDWPSWLSKQDRAFLQEAFPVRTAAMRHVCLRMLAESQKDRDGWVRFARRRNREYMMCWFVWTQKVGIRLAKHWADAYYGLYQLCGVHSSCVL